MRETPDMEATAAQRLRDIALADAREGGGSGESFYPAEFGSMVG